MFGLMLVTTGLGRNWNARNVGLSGILNELKDSVIGSGSSSDVELRVRHTTRDSSLEQQHRHGSGQSGHFSFSANYPTRKGPPTGPCHVLPCPTPLHPPYPASPLGPCTTPSFAHLLTIPLPSPAPTAPILARNYPNQPLHPTTLCPTTPHSALMSHPTHAPCALFPSRPFLPIPTHPTPPHPTPPCPAPSCLPALPHHTPDPHL